MAECTTILSLYQVGMKLAKVVCTVPTLCALQFTEAVVNLKFDEEPKYAAYSCLFEPLCGATPARPILQTDAPKVCACTSNCRLISCRLFGCLQSCGLFQPICGPELSWDPVILVGHSSLTVARSVNSPFLLSMFTYRVVLLFCHLFSKQRVFGQHCSQRGKDRNDGDACSRYLRSCPSNLSSLPQH